MADQEDENAGECSKSDKSEEYDPRLDFFSDKFDPLLALNNPNLKAPDPDAKLYDNVAILQSALKKKENPELNRKKVKLPDVEVKRKWLPHQLPVKGDSVFTKRRKNVFTRMEHMKGPLSILRKCVDDRLRIKVWNRHEKGIRGFCLGYVVAFDKHWNLALEEVLECWTRPKRRKVPALDSAEVNDEPLKRYKVPKITVTPHKTNKKLENCTRNVAQFMMRGEHIVFIQIVNEDDSSASVQVI